MSKTLMREMSERPTTDYDECQCGTGGWTAIKCCNRCGLPKTGEYWSILRIAELERERDEARETANRLNRRLQKAEGIIAKSGIVDNRPRHAEGRSLGRALANYAAEQYKRELDEARAELFNMTDQRDRWESEAQRYCRNADFWRGKSEELERERDEARASLKCSMHDATQETINVGKVKSAWITACKEREWKDKAERWRIEANSFMLKLLRLKDACRQFDEEQLEPTGRFEQILQKWRNAWSSTEGEKTNE